MCVPTASQFGMLGHVADRSGDYREYIIVIKPCRVCEASRQVACGYHVSDTGDFTSVCWCQCRRLFRVRCRHLRLGEFRVTVHRVSERTNEPHWVRSQVVHAIRPWLYVDIPHTRFCVWCEPRV